MTAAGQVPGTDVPATEFRDAMGHFATGVTVITSIGADGTPVGTTANAVTSLSLAPPLILLVILLTSDPKVMGARVSPPVLRYLGWITFVVMVAAAVGMLVTS